MYDLENGVETKLVKDKNYFLFGNPFMSHINTRTFLKRNSEYISGIMNEKGSYLYDVANDEFTSTGAPESIAPMTSVFLIVKEGVDIVEEGDEKAKIRLTTDMILPEIMTAEETGSESQAITVHAKTKVMTFPVPVLLSLR